MCSVKSLSHKRINILHFLFNNVITISKEMK